MTLNSFGCSFIFGTDLADTEHRKPYILGSQFTWPALLAKKLGYEYSTRARPGIGNLRILENILKESANPDNKIFVISWTWIDRFDYTVPADNLNPIGNWNLVDKDQWCTIVPAGQDNISKDYYRNFHSQLKDKLTTLIYIKTAIDQLNQKGIPFVMTYMDDLIFETEWHTTSVIIDLQNCIRPYMTKFEGHTFLEWSKKKGFPISETLHPLEPAHKAASELIQTNLDAILHKA